MMLSSLGLGEEISNLDLGRKVVEGDRLITNKAPGKVSIHADVFGQLMLDRISNKLKSTSGVAV